MSRFRLFATLYATAVVLETTEYIDQRQLDIVIKFLLVVLGQRPPHDRQQTLELLQPGINSRSARGRFGQRFGEEAFRYVGRSVVTD